MQITHDEVFKQKKTAQCRADSSEQKVWHALESNGEKGDLAKRFFMLVISDNPV